jgi:putative copper resistance protein D
MPMPEKFSWSHLGSTQLGVWPLILFALSSVAYVYAARRYEGWSRARTANWFAAVAVALVATQSVIGVYDMNLFADHMIQHLLLIMVAGPLFAAAAPLDLIRHSSPRLDRWCESTLGEIFLSPIFAFGLYAVFIPLTHLTGLFNAMLEHMWLHHLEQFLFLVFGYLFFRHVLGNEKGTTLHPGLGLVYVMAAVPVDTVSGLSLVMTKANPFPAYNVMHPMWASSIISDIHLGGAIMWIGGDFLMLAWLAPIVVRWLKFEARNTKIIDAELDRLGL